ncbi:MAG: phosphatase PAP2 family protein [Prevotella sp.]|nr:phosphatase PAP2 family protein [Prevotella sp.]
MFGLKASGVESRSSWSRMLLSDAVSMAMMTGVVQGLKHTTHVERPDGSNSNSFPSGHTATAFMTATMLTKEYGHLSPWVGVGAYTLATATGLMRIGNNKHWMSDVLVGAGVGLISTELSYWLVDAICKDRGLLRPGDDRPKPIDETRRPSFVGLYMGWNVPPGRVRVGEGLSYKASSGTTIGLEGAYFLNRYVGVGGRAALSNLQLEVDGVSSPDNMVDYTSLAVGPYFALPLGHRWSMGSKLLAGEVWYPETSLGSVIVARHHGLLFGTGLSLEYQLKNRMAGSLFVDDGFQIMPDSQNHGYLHTLAVGTKVAIRL